MKSKVPTEEMEEKQTRAENTKIYPNTYRASEYFMKSENTR
jgi:hypothetical protein